MNTYLIEHKIKTLAELYYFSGEDQFFEFQDFQFRQWEYTFSDGPLGDAWVAQKKIKAYNRFDAIKKFRKELFDIVRRVSLVSQCFSVVEHSYFILRLNNNPHNNFLCAYSEKVDHVGLHFGANEKNALLKLKIFDKPMAFEYIALSTQSVTYTGKLAMLITAMESIAGEDEKHPGRTNKAYIKNEILCDLDLYNKIFKHGIGIRNKIFHGKEIIEEEVNYASIIYDKIVDYFNRKYSIQINKEVVEPQRTPFGNYEVFEDWFTPPSDFSNWELRSIIAQIQKPAPGNGTGVGISLRRLKKEIKDY